MLQCVTGTYIHGARMMEKKGITLDDTTLQYCPGKIPELWPSTVSPITSVRLFRSWAPSWPGLGRNYAWQSLVNYAKQNGVKMLVATPVTCSERNDDQDWAQTKQLLQMLGPKHVMGFAVGNELELLYQNVRDPADADCARHIWDGGRFWRQFVQRVRELDDLGFGHVPITSVFTAGILYQQFPFTNVPGQALVNDFLVNATGAYGSRYTFTFNIYPYFDPNLKLDPDTTDSCNDSMRKALCWGNGCLATDAMVAARTRMAALTGHQDDRFWIGEIGWSSPIGENLHSDMQRCPNFSSTEAFTAFYEGFLHWDMKLTSVLPPDHVFFFTLRDALNFGVQEHFGLLTTCETPECKIYSGKPQHKEIDLSWLRWAFVAIAGIVAMMTICTAVVVHAGSRVSAGMKAVDSDSSGSD